MTRLQMLRYLFTGKRPAPPRQPAPAITREQVAALIDAELNRQLERHDLRSALVAHEQQGEPCA